MVWDISAGFLFISLTHEIPGSQSYGLVWAKVKRISPQNWSLLGLPPKGAVPTPANFSHS